MPFIKVGNTFVPQGHADDEGDVIFLLTVESHQPRPLKVSSQAMTRASRVFKAMFDPQFTGVAHFSSIDPLEVRLPDDDCQAMTWMCFALHLQDLPEGQMPIVLLRKLAILCDKYDCARALQSWSRLWLHEHARPCMSDKTKWDVLWMSYAFQNHVTFWQVSEDLIYGPIDSDDLDSVDDNLIDAADESNVVGMSLLPAGLSDSLEAERDGAAAQLRKMLRQIKAIYAKRTAHEENDVGKTSKLETRSQVEVFEERLIGQGLTPQLLEIEEMGVRDVLEKLDGCGAPQCLLMEDEEHERFSTHIQKCPFIEAERKTLGLCLLCVRRGKLSSNPKSFCMEGVDVSEQTLDFSRSDLVDRFKAPKLKRQGQSYETHNCMSPSRLEHHHSEDSHR